MIRDVQEAMMALDYGGHAVVVIVPRGLTLGGGCEIALHAARVQAAAETYIGLVEVGVGLIPAGGGTKEMLARAMEKVYRLDADFLPPINVSSRPSGSRKVASTSGTDAQRMSSQSEPTDAITMNTERLLSDARHRLCSVAPEGYRPPSPTLAIPVGGETVLAPLKLGVHLAWRAGRISDHDAVIGRKLAWILAGGNLRTRAPCRSSSCWISNARRS